MTLNDNLRIPDQVATRQLGGETVLLNLETGTYFGLDAVGSRFEIDHRTALARMDSAGATLTTTESALFELCRGAGTPEFKQISRLAREMAPAE